MKIKLLILLCLVAIMGCVRDKPQQRFPTDVRLSPDMHIDSSSIVGLYKYIFAVKCDVNGCHDGSFEPNFTTIESAYYTLVYHPINKNNASRFYKYRVVPYDTAHSVLYARISECCFVNKGDQMPQLSEMDKLSSDQIGQVAKWIVSGAKNIDGKTMILEDSIHK